MSPKEISGHFEEDLYARRAYLASHGYQADVMEDAAILALTEGLAVVGEEIPPGGIGGIGEDGRLYALTPGQGRKLQWPYATNDPDHPAAKGSIVAVTREGFEAHAAIISRYVGRDDGDR